MALFDVSEIGKNVLNRKSVTLPKERIKEEARYSFDDVKRFSEDFDNLEGYDDFTAEEYPKGFVFYDFEVFEYDWMVVLIDPVNKCKSIIVNDVKSLIRYWHSHSDMVWSGYNVIRYDVPILKSILSGMNPKRISDMIISGSRLDKSIIDKFDKIDMISFDLFVQISNAPSLKTLEAYMGNDIEETSVPFDIKRPLTEDEIWLTVKYCVHDVEQTIEVFRRIKSDWLAMNGLVSTFDLPFSDVGKTKAQLTAKIIGCERKEHDDEFEVKIVDTLRLSKYKYVKDWFEGILSMHDYGAVLPDTEKNKEILSNGRQTKENSASRVKFETNVCGVPHQFGWGGLHGAPEMPLHLKGKIYHADVTSFYPSLMIEYGLLTRNSSTPEKFKKVYDTRVALKKAGKKKEQQPYKIILNSQFGITKDKYSSAYDPVKANSICINGQLLLLDLLEKLELRLGERFSLIQSNTDGIIVMIADDDSSERIFCQVVKSWCTRTRMGMGFDKIDEIWQKDVNNYLFKFSDGKVERKGAYLMELSDLSYDLPIVNKAMIEYMLHDVPVERTILECNKMMEFQKVYRVTKSYKFGWHNYKMLNERTYRVFASLDESDTYVGRCRDYGSNPDKFGNCPDHAFIYNKSVKDIPMSLKLDKMWYVRLAKKRLAEFGLDVGEVKRSLF